MNSSPISSIFPVAFSILIFSIIWPAVIITSADIQQETFIQCLSNNNNNTSNPNEFIYTQTLNSDSYFTALNYSIRNPRFASPSTPKPLVIVTPSQVSQVQKAINCSKKNRLQIRIRSGGHDYEGLSYVSKVPFFILDLINIKSVTVNVPNRTAWIESGATLGEVYYRIAKKTLTLGFPAGVCHTVGVGGHFSGGGHGTLTRKYGLAADNIIDALVVDAGGRALDRASMGEDFFWAIRGGGGASFGVVLAWKVKLVPVPPTVTVFTLNKNLAQNATSLVQRWQFIADKFHDNLYVRVIIQAINSPNGRKTIQVSFNSLFLGTIDHLLPLMSQDFPELGLKREDCIEMSWIESVLYFDGFRGQPLEVLLDRSSPENSLSFKAKSDYVKNPIPLRGLEGIWERLYEEEAGRGILIMTPNGGKMYEISKSEIPYPYRAGDIYEIQYLIYWVEEANNVTQAQTKISWIRRLYSYMTPYVSKNPRSAYLNYRDLDIGTNNENGTTSYAKASIFGTKYFNDNFRRLVRVKSKVDPNNFYRNEQSIPSLPSSWKRSH